MHIIMVLLLTFSVFAQHSEQPQKENNTDLRNSTAIFMIEDVGNEKIYGLERTSQMDHFLRMKEDGNEETLRKVDSKDAKKMEMDFASRFLKIQYEIETAKGDCKMTYRLALQGESQEICKKDEKKGQEIAPFLNQIKKRF